MINPYYAIWVDGLKKLKSLPRNTGMWKFYGMTFISLAMTFNLMLIMLILENYVFGQAFYTARFYIFSNPVANILFRFIILFLAPPLIINYFFIFYNNRYEKLFEKYKSYNGKLYLSYVLTSLLLPVTLLLIAKIVYEINN